MYLKVYYGPVGKQDATIEDVTAALPQDMEGLTVDGVLGYPSVNFPDGAPFSDWERVQKALQAAGFETE